MLKLSENPPVRSAHVEDTFELPGKWWIAHTKARFEKAFAWDLHDRKIDYFLPLVERTSLSGGKRRKVLKPLFPSYVFFSGDDEARYQALTTGRLCQVVAVTDQEKLVQELVAVNRALAGSGELDFYPFPAVGTRWRVTMGPFEGLEGTVVEYRGQLRLVLQVSMLGQGASLEIEADLLEPVETEEHAIH